MTATTTTDNRTASDKLWALTVRQCADAVRVKPVSVSPTFNSATEKAAFSLFALLEARS